MTTETTALTLPDEATFKRDIQAINRFQQVVHSTMVEGLDYGVIPGTQRPTLLKPGAEKIAKLLGLADQYEIVNQLEDWQVPFFRYLIKCKLVHVATGVIISEGMGECNSMEAKYRWRWVSDRDLPVGVDKATLISQERRSSKTGGHWTVYRLGNDDIYSQVNTILKMAKKRALVDAALSAGRLSDVFSQDLEDLPPQTFTAEKPAERARKEQPKPQAQTAVADEPELGDEPEPAHDIPEEATNAKTAGFFNVSDLTDKMKQAKFPEKTVLSWIRSKANYQGLDISGKFADILARMSKEQAEFLMKEIEDRISMA